MFLPGSLFPKSATVRGNSFFRTSQHKPYKLRKAPIQSKLWQFCSQAFWSRLRNLPACGPHSSPLKCCQRAYLASWIKLASYKPSKKTSGKFSCKKVSLSGSQGRFGPCYSSSALKTSTSFSPSQIWRPYCTRLAWIAALIQSQLCAFWLRSVLTSRLSFYRVAEAQMNPKDSSSRDWTNSLQW